MTLLRFQIRRKMSEERFPRDHASVRTGDLEFLEYPPNPFLPGTVFVADLLGRERTHVIPKFMPTRGTFPGSRFARCKNKLAFLTTETMIDKWSLVLRTERHNSYHPMKRLIEWLSI